MTKKRKTRAPGAGRPTLYGPKTHRFSICLTDEAYRLAQDLAGVLSTSISNAIESALRSAARRGR